MAKSALPTVIVMVFAVIIGGHLVMELRAERQSVAQLRERMAASDSAQRGAESTADMPLASTQLEPTPTTAATLAQALTKVPSGGMRDTNHAAEARARIRRIYGDVEHELGLSAEEMAAFVRLMARGNATQSEIETVLGAKYAQLQEMALFADVGRKLEQLRSTLASSAHQLTDQQVERFGPAMLAESRRRNELISALPKSTEPRVLLNHEDQKVRLTEESNERLIAAAWSYLDPEQIAVMQGMMNTQLNAQRMALQARRARFEAGDRRAAELPSIRHFYPTGTTPP